MSEGFGPVGEARIHEIAHRHKDLLSRMGRIDDALARRVMNAVVRADSAVPFAMACGEQAMRLRAEMEQVPSADPARDLRQAVAYCLDQMAGRYPANERFAPRFRFDCAEADPRFGPGYRVLFAWEFERVFVAPSGRVLAPYAVPAVERLAGALAVPLPADFFRLTTTAETMAATASLLYCRQEGQNPQDRLSHAFRSVHPEAAGRLLDDANAAVALAEAAVLAAAPPPAPEPSPAPFF